MEPEPLSPSPSPSEPQPDDAPASSPLRPSLPPGRVKRIAKLDRDIKTISAESIHVITLATELFLGHLSQEAARVARGKKKKTVRLDHIRAAVRAHRPTKDFLLDCLPEEEPAPKHQPREKADKADAVPAPLPHGARRIDQFFQKKAEAMAVDV